MRESDYTPNPTLLTQDDIDKLTEIQNLLDEGLAHYLTYEGHCKSSEGHVSVNLANSWDRRRGENPITVEVYSYVLGPHRSHSFDSVDEALEEVRKWHAQEMEYDPDTEENLAAAEEMTQAAQEFIETMLDQGRLTVINVGEEDNLSTTCKECGEDGVTDDLGCMKCYATKKGWEF